MQIASMMVRKSRVEIVICCGGGAEVLDTTTSVGEVLGVGGPKKTEGSRVGGTGSGGGDAGTEAVGA